MKCDISYCFCFKSNVSKPFVHVMNRFGITKSQICMVGDRLDTDILFGQNGGCKTLLVLSGNIFHLSSPVFKCLHNADKLIVTYVFSSLQGWPLFQCFRALITKYNLISTQTRYPISYHSRLQLCDELYQPFSQENYHPWTGWCMRTGSSIAFIICLVK